MLFQWEYMLCPIMLVWLLICAVKPKQPAMFGFQFQKDEEHHQKWIFFFTFAKASSGAVVPKPGGMGGEYPQ